MDQTAPIKRVVIGVASLFLLIVAILLDLQYLYLMSAALFMLPFASRQLSLRLAARYHVHREHAATAQEGRLLTVTLNVEAEGGLPQASLRIRDSLPAEVLPVREEAAKERTEREDAARREHDGTASAPAAEPPLDADGRHTTDDLVLDHWDGRRGSRTYAIEPIRRGVYWLGPARLVTTDPLGLFTFEVALDVPTELVVHPTPLPVSDRPVGSGGAFGVRDREGRARRGEGIDFHGVREWRPGDGLRRVHWRTTARTGKLAVIEFERAFQRDVVIGLDLARGTEHGRGRETTLEYAVKAAATLVDRTLLAGGGVSLVTQAGRVEVHPGQGPDPGAARFRLFDLLARVRADKDGSLADALRAARPADGSYFVILTAAGDPRLAAYLSERVQRGDTVRVYFFEPASFGGPPVMSPAMASGELRVVQRGDSPWRDGGRNLEYLLRDDP